MTVFSADLLTRLGHRATTTAVLGGVGGVVEAVTVDTQIRLPCDDGGRAAIRGEFSAFVRPDVLDMSVLGRDISDLFAVIVDRQADVVTLIRSDHRYRIDAA